MVATAYISYHSIGDRCVVYTVPVWDGLPERYWCFERLSLTLNHSTVLQILIPVALDLGREGGREGREEHTSRTARKLGHTLHETVRWSLLHRAGNHFVV